MPITSPSLSKMGPPLLPGAIEASIWTSSNELVVFGLMALIVPLVKVGMVEAPEENKL